MHNEFCLRRVSTLRLILLGGSCTAIARVEGFSTGSLHFRLAGDLLPGDSALRSSTTRAIPTASPGDVFHFQELYPIEVGVANLSVHYKLPLVTPSPALLADCGVGIKPWNH